ncbi:MAG: ABC-2 transporter permease [Lachnospiraceae bacterium]|jgi:ABC-2 type transport system permease protein
MMIVNLIRKEFLLAQKAVVRTAVLCLLMIVVLIASDGSSSFQNNRFGFLIFLYFLLLVVVTWLSQAAVEEEKNPHAAALLCAAPYSRKNFVVAKYICYLILFAGSVALYSIIAALHPGLNFLSAAELLLGFLVGAFLYGLYTNAAIRYGMAKAQYIVTATILIMVFVPMILVRFFRPELILFQLFLDGSGAAVPAILAGASVCVFFVFLSASIHCFEKKEL